MSTIPAGLIELIERPLMLRLKGEGKAIAKSAFGECADDTSGGKATTEAFVERVQDYMAEIIGMGGAHSDLHQQHDKRIQEIANELYNTATEMMK